MEYGVDVHPTYQRGLSFPLLARQGYGVAVVKATEGIGFVAPNFAAWIAQARAAGLIPGAYHWIKAGNGAGQAEFFFDTLRSVGGHEGLLIQLDCEDNASYADVLAWRDRWKALSGEHPFFLYTGGWWWLPRGWNGPNVTPYLWTSHYLSADADTVADDPIAFANRIPASWWAPGYGGWPRATGVQFTSKGDAGTLGNNVDLNAFDLTRNQLLAMTGSAGAPPTGGSMALNEGDVNNAAKIVIWNLQGWLLENVQRTRNVENVVAAMALKIDIDPAELAAITAAANAGAAAGVVSAAPALIDQVVARVIDALPDGTTEPLTAAAVETAVRHAFSGGLAPSEVPQT